MNKIVRQSILEPPIANDVSQFMNSYSLNYWQVIDGDGSTSSGGNRRCIVYLFDKI